jgi:hypothetical protein
VGNANFGPLALKFLQTKVLPTESALCINIAYVRYMGRDGYTVIGKKENSGKVDFMNNQHYFALLTSMSCKSSIGPTIVHWHPSFFRCSMLAQVFFLLIKMLH